MAKQTKDQRTVEFARITEIDRQAVAIMRERGCSLAEAWLVVLDGSTIDEGAAEPV